MIIFSTKQRKRDMRFLTCAVLVVDAENLALAPVEGRRTLRHLDHTLHANLLRPLRTKTARI